MGAIQLAETALTISGGAPEKFQTVFERLNLTGVATALMSKFF